MVIRKSEFIFKKQKAVHSLFLNYEAYNIRNCERYKEYHQMVLMATNKKNLCNN